MRKWGTIAAAILIVASNASADRRTEVPPQYPPEMIPAEGRPLPVVKVEPVDVDDAGRIVPLAQGTRVEDVPKPSAPVANHEYASWSAWPPGTQAWMDAESLGPHGRRDDRRLVKRVERWSIDGVLVDEFWAERSGILRDGSSAGHSAMLTPDWDLIPRRGGPVVFWRVYRARVTASEAAGATSRPSIAPGGAPGEGLLNADGFVRPERLLCTVVEWCERVPAVMLGDDAGPNRVRLTREVRHPLLPGGVLQMELGAASLDAELGLTDDRITYRTVLDRVIASTTPETTEAGPPPESTTRPAIATP